MNKIVVGIDDSPGARAALRWAVGQAKVTGAKIEAVYAFDFHVTWDEEPGVQFEDWRSRAELLARESLNEVLADVSLSPDDGLISAVAVEGSPAPILIAASMDADLLVVGSRGRGGFGGLLLGSVSQHCVGHAKCPVVVVPAPS